MPTAFHLDHDLRCVFSRAWGRVVDDELFAHATMLRAHPGFDPGYRQCMDFHDVTAVEVTSEAIRRMVEFNPFRPDSKRALVVNRVVMHGLARMYQLAGDLSHEHVRPLQTLAEAFEWLGLPADTPWPTGEPHWSSVLSDPA